MTISGTGLRLVQSIAVPNTGVVWSFDLAAVDPQRHSYYLADVTNASLDIFNTSSLTLTKQITGNFAGTGNPPPNLSPPQAANYAGPDGVIAVPGTSKLFVGDINSVKVVDAGSGSTTQTIPTGTSGFRTDEGCYDGDDGLVMFTNPADKPPFVTWISASTNGLAGTYAFTTSAGLEACVYNPALKSFMINNDGTPTNPSGEVDVIPAASVVAGHPVVSAAYPLPGCSPGGMALGSNDELGVACFAPETLILKASTGQILTTIQQVGGGDAMAFDPILNRFYVAAFLNGAKPDGSGGTPVLGIIDGKSLSWIGNIPTSFLAHSVAVDPSTGYVYVPVLASPTRTGSVNVYAPSGQ